MYIPSAFAVDDLPTLHQFIEQHSFALLCSADADGMPFVTHLPFLLDRSTGPHGTLHGHMAKANPHWQTADGKPVLVVFAGPHHYISPAWYESEKVVPTWNYATVHAQGVLRVTHDERQLLRIVRETVSYYESSRPSPWQMEEGTFTQGLLKGIVGFEIEITRLLGKMKMSQNHPAERREKVRKQLRELGGAEANAVAEMMEWVEGRTAGRNTSQRS